MGQKNGPKIQVFVMDANRKMIVVKLKQKRAYKNGHAEQLAKLKYTVSLNLI